MLPFDSPVRRLPGHRGEPEPAAALSTGLREVFAQPGYRRLWAARTVSPWGDTLNVVALALLVYDLTGSGLGVSGVVAAEIAPVLLLASFAGALIDRWPRVRVMVAADVLRLFLAGLLAIWHEAPAGVYAIAFGMSVGAVFFNPAASSVLPALVPKADLIAANTGIWTAAVLSQIALAPLAGLLVTPAGPGPAFAVNALSYAVSALLLVGLRVPGHPSASAGDTCWPMPATASASSWDTGCSGRSPSASSSPRCRPERPAHCSSSWPATTWVPRTASTGC